MRSHSDKLNPREIGHLDHISKFTNDIRHIDGTKNEVADALSRPSIAHLQLSSGIDLNEMAAEQRRVGSPCDEDVSGLQLQKVPMKTGYDIFLCDVSTPSHSSFVPPSVRRKVISSLHNLSHTGSRATDRLVSDRFVWSGMHKDLHQQILQRRYSPPSVQPGDTVAVRVSLPSAFVTLLYCPPHPPCRYAVGRRGACQ
nr:unnamed protein product [Spirometra erinaceieuropaei]